MIDKSPSSFSPYSGSLKRGRKKRKRRREREKKKERERKRRREGERNVVSNWSQDQLERKKDNRVQKKNGRS